MDTKIYIDDKLAEKWRELAMKRFGYGRGSISKAAEEAIAFWVANEETIQRTIEKLKEIAKREESIDALILFGSYARKEIYHDIDVAAMLKDRKKGLKILADLESVLPQYPVFDLSLFNDLPIAMQLKVLREGKPIYVRESVNLVEIYYDLLLKWIDLEPIVSTYGLN
jgi:predicted nucleotidyltransferase